ncbi:MAG: YcgN family cysteine cluster protein, partial [Gammaproteobacteria bacterium]|nr:YcgN family cysteine cluster protein [Gammaproteobacteria bacterium]
EIFYTAVACKLLNLRACRCKHYATRLKHVPDCIVLKKEHLGHLGWLPDSCAYRRLDEGRGLADWHPLISGSPDSVHEAGISVRNKARSARSVPEEEYEHHMIDWIGPGQRSSKDVP